MKASGSLISRRRFLRTTCAVGVACAGFVSLRPLQVLAATGGREDLHQRTRLLMGTVVTIEIISPEFSRAQAAFAAAFSEMERLAGVFDRRRPASALGMLNARGVLADAPRELRAVLDEAGRLGRATEYAFNPAVAPLVDLFAAAGQATPDRREVAEAMALAKPDAIHMSGGTVRLGRQGMRLTLDGIAKGFIVDAASAALRDLGMDNHMVNAGGDIRVSGHAGKGAPWRIGLRHPGGNGKLLAAAPLKSGGLATSGSYERYYNASRSRHHLVSHLTGKSPETAGVTVRAATAMQADALATAFSLLPPALALRHSAGHDAVECLIIDRHGRRFASAGWA